MPCFQAHEHAPPSSSPPVDESLFVMCHVFKLTSTFLHSLFYLPLNTLYSLQFLLLWTLSLMVFVLCLPLAIYSGYHLYIHCRCVTSAEVEYQNVLLSATSPEFHQIFPINGIVYRFTRNEILIQAFIPGNHADMNLAPQ